VRFLRDYDVPTLILVGITSTRSQRRQIWQYLSQWLTVKPPLNGHDLKALGYKPGKQFKIILDRLLAAYLDGELGTSEDPAVIRTAGLNLLQQLDY
jgi:tRNA nucleotidyltransferase (CCA-adding enzyme)